MLPKLRCIVIVLMALWTASSNAMQFIEPKPEVTKLARELAYEDFPKVSDIFTIIRIESGFNPRAKNNISNGLMQVNHGSFNIRQNMIQGVSILRQYYLMTHSKEAAIRSYNIGIGNYFNGLMKRSADDYWNKFQSQVDSYIAYEKLTRYKIREPDPCLTCNNTLLAFSSPDNCRRPFGIINVNYYPEY